MTHAHPQSPTKIRAFARPIHGRQLMFRICNAAGLKPSVKLPKEFQSTLSLVLPSDRLRSYDAQGGKHTYWPFEGYHTVTITPAVSQGVPRVFVTCKCGEQIPFGRVNQHAHEPKYGTIQIASH